MFLYGCFHISFALKTFCHCWNQLYPTEQNSSRPQLQLFAVNEETCYSHSESALILKREILQFTLNIKQTAIAL